MKDHGGCSDDFGWLAQPTHTGASMVRKLNKQKYVLFQTFVEDYVSVTTSRLMKNVFESLLRLRSMFEIWTTEGAPLIAGRGEDVHLPPKILKLRSSEMGFPTFRGQVSLIECIFFFFSLFPSIRQWRPQYVQQPKLSCFAETTR